MASQDDSGVHGRSAGLLETDVRDFERFSPSFDAP